MLTLLRHKEKEILWPSQILPMSVGTNLELTRKFATLMYSVVVDKRMAFHELDVSFLHLHGHAFFMVSFLIHHDNQGNVK